MSRVTHLLFFLFNRDPPCREKQRVISAQVFGTIAAALIPVYYCLMTNLFPQSLLTSRSVIPVVFFRA